MRETPLPMARDLNARGLGFCPWGAPGGQRLLQRDDAGCSQGLPGVLAFDQCCTAQGGTEGAPAPYSLGCETDRGGPSQGGHPSRSTQPLDREIITQKEDRNLQSL